MARAQSTTPQQKIGYLHPVDINTTTTVQIMRPVWVKLGYIEGETVLLRWAEGDPRRLPGQVAELMRLGVGVLIVVGPTALRAAGEVSKTLPIVAIDLETDPVRAGFAASFGRPGGNVTGLFLDQPSLAGKWIELLKEAAPRIERLALVWEPTTGPNQLDPARAAAQTMGLELIVLEVRTSEGYEEAFRNVGGQPKTGIVQLSSPIVTHPPARLA